MQYKRTGAIRDKAIKNHRFLTTKNKKYINTHLGILNLVKTVGKQVNCTVTICNSESTVM